MAKVKLNSGKSGYTFLKELGGASDRKILSKTAQVLIDRKLIRGRVLDYGCGYGNDADQLGWDAYDPYYRLAKLTGLYDTIIVNHVVNILTRDSRMELMEKINDLLAENGTAYISVARNIPKLGKHGPRRRIQNYVILTLPSIYDDKEEEIYGLTKNTVYHDHTHEFEKIL